MLSEKRILEYWRDSIQDAILMSPELKDNYSKIDAKQALEGKIQNDIKRKLFQEFSNRRKKIEKNEPLPDFIEVLVAPYVFAPYSHGIIWKTLVLASAVWIPARLDNAGNLQANAESSPWIARELLEPSKDGDLIIGTLDDYLEKYKAQVFEGKTWKDATAFIQTLFKSVSGIELDNWHPDEYRRAKAAIMLVPDTAGDAKTKLFELCNRWLEKNSSLPPLLKNVLSTQDKKPESISSVSEASPPFTHFGHMGTHGLNDEQRTAVRYAMRLSEGQALAVNGPPGTGKTSILQGVIASYMVRAALEGKKEPPVILATSTNNIAVTNIIDSFTKPVNGDSSHHLSQHWLPDIRGIGVRIPSQDALRKEGGNYQNMDEIRQMLFSQETIESRQRYFLEQYSKWLGTAGGSLDKAITTLHSKLSETVPSIQAFEKILPPLAKRLVQYQGQTVTEKKKAIEAASEGQQSILRDAQQTIAGAKAKLRQLLTEEANTPWYLVMLSFIPAIRTHRAQKLSLSALNLGIETISLQKSYTTTAEVIHTIREWFQAVEAQYSSIYTKAAEAVEYHKASMGLFLEYETLLQKNGIEADTIFDLRKALQLLDKTLRVKAYYLALHYWEAVFLSTSSEWKNEGWEDKEPQKEYSKRNFLKTMAMVTPCFVATVYMSVGKFDFFAGRAGKGDPLEGVIDLMIFDESGQVGPELGLPLLGLAKRALIVGDVKQLAPISVAETTDIVRLKHNQIDNSAMQWLTKRGLSCSASNVMLAAHQLTAFTDDHTTPGIMLRDHYRCLPEIIAYCDELTYEGLLRPVRTPIENAPFPAMGYAHIRGQAEKAGRSWRNALEARTIADWLHQNYDAIMEWGNQPEKQKPGSKQRPLDEIVAIVTPYRPQVSYLRNEIKKKFAGKENEIEELTVNTVHALQGAECDIVIFSPVVRAQSNTTPLHDRSDRMLNVAVSRAKDAFLVFGDMELFKETSGARPSSLLAKYLYRHPDNQLANIIPSFGYVSDALQSHVISGLEQHEKILSQVLRQAQDKILISSPFLSSAALTDETLRDIEGCVKRGVKLLIMTDSSFDIKQKELRAPARLARDRLTETGATVCVTDRIHAKTLCMDSSLLIEGSFNWFSATRDSDKSRLDRSLMSQGEAVTSSYIEDAWKEMESKTKEIWRV